jgi:hypothetical protein
LRNGQQVIFVRDPLHARAKVRLLARVRHGWRTAQKTLAAQHECAGGPSAMPVLLYRTEQHASARERIRRSVLPLL